MKTKTLIAIAALAFALSSCTKDLPNRGGYTEPPTGQMNTPVALDMQYMDCLYQSCFTSVDLPLGDEEIMTGTYEQVNTGARSSCIYTFYSETHDSGNPWSMDYQFQDINCGTIEAGDTLIPLQVRYTSCGVTTTVREDQICTLSFSGDTVTIEYHDCIIPLNGLSGYVNVKFVQ